MLSLSRLFQDTYITHVNKQLEILQKEKKKGGAGWVGSSWHQTTWSTDFLFSQKEVLLGATLSRGLNFLP